MRSLPLLSLLLAALSLPATAATGERQAQSAPSAQPGGGSTAPAAAGGSTARGPTLPQDSTVPPSRPTPPPHALPPAGSQPVAPSHGGAGSQGSSRPQGQGGSQGQGQTQGQGQAPDNTGRNRDRDNRVEADDQSNAAADVEAVAGIRRALTRDDSLSMQAHNVKIVVQGNRVTLRGPVRDAAEKHKVETIVRRAAGNRQVVNELEAKGR